MDVNCGPWDKSLNPIPPPSQPLQTTTAKLLSPYQLGVPFIKSVAQIQSDHIHQSNVVRSHWFLCDRFTMCLCLLFYDNSKHILNVQVSVRAPCCKQWFDCAECHAEQQGSSHNLAKTLEMVFLCKKCRRAFRKDMSAYEESDEFCPYCDNHYVRV